MFGSLFSRDVALLASAFLVLVVLMYADDYLPAASTVGVLNPETPVRRDELPRTASKPIDADVFIPVELRIPPQLMTRVSGEFTNMPLNDFVKWMRDEQHVDVLLDEDGLAEEGLSIDEPITERIARMPLHGLLDNICDKLELEWYHENGIVKITTEIKADETLRIVSYNLADFIDRGYQPYDLITSITATLGRWEVDGDGVGSINRFKEKLFVRQSLKVQHEIFKLLSELRFPHERTFVNDRRQHVVLREILRRPVHVIFQGEPLHQAIASLSHQTGAAIQIEGWCCDQSESPFNTPVRLKVGPQPFSQILDTILTPQNLSWVLKDDEIRVMTLEDADDQMVVAVYDVGDKCRNEREADILKRTLKGQMGHAWVDNRWITPAVTFPKPEVMVVLQTEFIHDKILELLRHERMSNSYGNGPRIETVPRLRPLPSYPKDEQQPVANATGMFSLSDGTPEEFVIRRRLP
ncbi:MAG: hypothetical protein O2955_06790 [Planctomycetota bacterium]|nr:hypothetical protein [Planctomycetota bacterium]MDA1212202.1 hypothetical protein [Planctomycetota bacterium]